MKYKFIVKLAKLIIPSQIISVITRILEGQIDVTPGVTFDSSAPET